MCFRCKFCKNLYRFSRLDLVSHQADSACTPHVKKSKQIAVEVDRMITRKYKEIEKLTSESHVRKNLDYLNTWRE